MSLDKKKVEEVFAAALGIAIPAEREVFVGRVCGTDKPLREEVLSLLAAHEDRTQSDSHLGTMPNHAKPAETALKEKSGIRVGRYKLLEKIGEGAFGDVWMAEQEEPVRRRVALKVIKLGMDTREVIARFEAERQALALMDHPNIARVFDGGTTESGRPYFAMELVRGLPMTKFCDEHRLTTDQRLELLVEVCHAVQHAHQKGVIHRDLKPSNILVMEQDGRAMPKVIDFGIARATGQRLTERTLFTQLGQVVGTPSYMSPEQAGLGGLDVDARSDIYSLGVVLYELLVGCPPFKKQELLEAGLEGILRIIRENEAPRPSTRLSTLALGERNLIGEQRRTEPQKLNRVLQGELDWIAMRCLEKDRNRRYQTASALAADLRRHLNNEPVLARPPSAAYQIQKAWRRHRLAFTATALVAAALVIGAAVSIWQAVEAEHARSTAVRAQAAESRERSRAEVERDKAQVAQKLAEQERDRADAERAVAIENHYLASMQLAQQAWEQNNVGRLQELLNETADYPQRGFEWYYWRRQIHPELMTLQHSEPVLAVQYSRDGKRIATGANRGAHLWDAASGKKLLSIADPAVVGSVALSPDGRQLLTVSDETGKIWDTSTGALILKLEGHTSRIACVAYSPDGERIVTGGTDRTAKIWDASSGRNLITLEGHGSQVLSAAFSPDSQRIVTSSEDRSAKTWDARTGKVLVTVTNATGMNTVSFSPDGSRIAAGAPGQETVKVWDANAGKELLSLTNSNTQVLSISFSPDGKRLVAAGVGYGGAGHTARVWDAIKGIQVLSIKGHSGPIYGTAYSPDGKSVATASLDRTVKLWSAAETQGMLSLTGPATLSFTGHTAQVTAIAFSPKGDRILTSGADRTARVWDLVAGKELSTLETSGWINSANFASDGTQILTASVDANQALEIWDVNGGSQLSTFRLWPRQFSPGIPSPSAAAFSLNGRRLVTGYRDGTGAVWETATGTELTALKGHNKRILSLVFAPDSQRIVSGSVDGMAKIWNAATGAELFTLTVQSLVYCVAFSADGQQIFTGGEEQTAVLWDARNGQQLLTLKGHAAAVIAAAFSPDGRRIVTGSTDGTVRVWDTKRGKQFLTLKGHSMGVSSVAFSPDNQRVFSGGTDGTIRVWDSAAAEGAAR